MASHGSTANYDLLGRRHIKCKYDSSSNTYLNKQNALSKINHSEWLKESRWLIDRYRLPNILTNSTQMPQIRVQIGANGKVRIAGEQSPKSHSSLLATWGAYISCNGSFKQSLSILSFEWISLQYLCRCDYLKEKLTMPPESQAMGMKDRSCLFGDLPLLHFQIRKTLLHVRRTWSVGKGLVYGFQDSAPGPKLISANTYWWKEQFYVSNIQMSEWQETKYLDSPDRIDGRRMRRPVSSAPYKLASPTDYGTVPKYARGKMELSHRPKKSDNDTCLMKKYHEGEAGRYLIEKPAPL